MILDALTQSPRFPIISEPLKEQISRSTVQMQSDRSRDVVLESSYMAHRDEGRILYKNMKSKTSGIFIMKIFKFKTD